MAWLYLEIFVFQSCWLRPAFLWRATNQRKWRKKEMTVSRLSVGMTSWLVTLKAQRITEDENYHHSPMRVSENRLQMRVSSWMDDFVILQCGHRWCLQGHRWLQMVAKDGFRSWWETVKTGGEWWWLLEQRVLFLKHVKEFDSQGEMESFMYACLCVFVRLCVLQCVVTFCSLLLMEIGERVLSFGVTVAKWVPGDSELGV